MYNLFRQICKMSQGDLKDYLAEKLKETHNQVVIGDGFVYAQGKFPVLLVAHLDTVHKELPKTFEYDAISSTLSSPQGIGADDRCGVYMILETIKYYNCSVLFCEDEEIGGIGAKKFTQTELAKGLTFNYIMEFDRKGHNDAVFYDCGNLEFERFITSEYYKTAYGSFSDISIVAPALGCAAVNLSCGYYNAHTTKEFVAMSEMEKSISAACDILERTTEADVFEYIECEYGYDEWDWYEEGRNCYLIEYYDRNYNEGISEVYAMSEAEAIGKFCIEHSDIPFENVYGIEAYGEM